MSINRVVGKEYMSLPAISPLVANQPVASWQKRFREIAQYAFIAVGPMVTVAGTFHKDIHTYCDTAITRMKEDDLRRRDPDAAYTQNCEKELQKMEKNGKEADCVTVARQMELAYGARMYDEVIRIGKALPEDTRHKETNGHFQRVTTRLRLFSYVEICKRSVGENRLSAQDLEDAERLAASMDELIPNYHLPTFARAYFLIAAGKDISPELQKKLEYHDKNMSKAISIRDEREKELPGDTDKLFYSKIQNERDKKILKELHNSVKTKLLDSIEKKNSYQ